MSKRQCLVCDSEDKKLSYFSFPDKFPEIKKIWKEFCVLFGVLRENDDTKSCLLCSQHFTPDCLVVTPTGLIRLKKKSIPTIFKAEQQNPNTEKIPDYYLKDKFKEVEKFAIELSKNPVQELTKKEKNANAIRRRKMIEAALSDHDYFKQEPCNDSNLENPEISSSKLMLLNICEKNNQVKKQCRICLTDNAENNLFTSMVEDEPMDKFYREVFSVELQENDKLPQNICIACTQALDLFYFFKKKVMATESELKDMIKQEEELTLKIAELEEAAKMEQEQSKKLSATKRIKINVPRDRKQGKTLAATRKIKIKKEARDRKQIKKLPASEKIKIEDSPRDRINEKTQCDTCGKFVANLNQHKIIHRGIKVFICEICGKGFNYKKNLGFHINIHNNVKPYQCTLCDAKFSSNATLWRHSRTVHLGRKFKYPKPWNHNNIEQNCPHCGRLYFKYSSLKAHIQAKHKSKNQKSPKSLFRCWCGEKFMDRKSKMKHNKENHPKFLQCPVCPIKYVGKEKLGAHIKENHVSTTDVSTTDVLITDVLTTDVSTTDVSTTDVSTNDALTTDIK